MTFGILNDGRHNHKTAHMLLWLLKIDVKGYNTEVKLSRAGRKGFTLVELLIIMAIIAVLAGIALPAYFSYVSKAKIIKTVSALDSLRKVLEVYVVERYQYPTSIDFTTFTDQDGNLIGDSANLSKIRDDVFSFDSYVVVPNGYIIIAKAVDADHTVVTVRPEKISY